MKNTTYCHIQLFFINSGFLVYNGFLTKAFKSKLAVLFPDLINAADPVEETVFE